MSEQRTTIKVDGVEIKAKAGQRIIEACDESGVYIPRLCYFKDLAPHGSCRICIVKVNGRMQTACTQPVADGMEIENNTEEINRMRQELVEMLFIEGNHVCPSCEKSGNCELQAVAYRLGITGPRLPYQFPQREVDATHPDIYLDLNRCILCGRCVQASRDLDGKHVFDFVERGPEKKISIDAAARLKDTDLDITDKVVDICPVGTILKKRVGFTVPVGERLYDKKPIGSDIESKKVGKNA